MHQTTIVQEPQRAACAAPGGTTRRAAVRPVAPPVLASAVQRRRQRACRLLWHERVSTAAAHAIQVRVPLVGGTDPDLATRLSSDLQQAWAGRKRFGGELVTSVAAVIGRAEGVDSLIVFLSLDRLPPRQRVDDVHMARELQHAIDRCTLAAA